MAAFLHMQHDLKIKNNTFGSVWKIDRKKLQKNNIGFGIVLSIWSGSDNFCWIILSPHYALQTCLLIEPLSFWDCRGSFKHSGGDGRYRKAQWNKTLYFLASPDIKSLPTFKKSGLPVLNKKILHSFLP